MPTAQVPVTAVSPMVPQKLPAGQLVQLAAPVVAKKKPTAQFEHELAEAAEYVPTAQVPVAAVRPVVPQKLPEGQLVQLAAPVVA